MNIYDTREGVRLQMNQQREGHWNRWGPYVAERAWGTVREDYSKDGDAWSYFPHDHARSRAYRWNEDGIAGICDRHQYLCFALALWNTHDSILKERMFGLTAREGNHGEDVKEYYFYLDNTPTHSYMKYLYKYPHAAYPYEQLLEENRSRGRLDREYELVDTGIFDQGRYFDVGVEYAKVDPEDILIRISVTNRGPETAPIHVLPTLWFRNTWTWGRDKRRPLLSLPVKTSFRDSQVRAILAKHYQLGEYLLYCSTVDEFLFTENETNSERLFGVASSTSYVKDAFHSYLIGGNRNAVNLAAMGTKAAAHYRRDVRPGETVLLRLRLAAVIDNHADEDPFADFDANIKQRQEEADEFYGVALPSGLSADAKLIARQAFAGLLWSKQYYHYVVTDWLQGDPTEPPPPTERLHGRNCDWVHFFSRDVLSVPDKWEFPWFASWDTGFHCVALAYVDPQFAKDQILLMLREWYMHPNGQIPAYEWDFGDVNPPVLSMAAHSVFEVEREQTGVADYAFLERVFQKMLLNFTWWVNRKDALGKNIFQGGFLGMDNIGAFDRDNLPPGYLLGQADGTSWMAAFAKNMMSIALILAERDPVYEDLASKFWEHYVYIAFSMNNPQDSSNSLWDQQDGFFYDYLYSERNRGFPVRARTMVGFVPLFGGTTVSANTFDRYPDFQRRRQWFIDHRPDLVESIQPMVVPGANQNLLLGFVREDQLRRILAYMLDENEFLSPFGVRAVSRFHLDHPLVLHLGGQEYRLDYEPGESTTQLFGGNSNWRGPVWMPVNHLILLALRQYHMYYGESFKIECPTGSGKLMTLAEIAHELALRLAQIFLLDKNGNRPLYGSNPLFNNDPYWRDLIFFHEYFHGDNGRGCGASHQTGWTGLVAQLLIFLGEAASGESLPNHEDL
jgi:Mannosylglycerate hydrolase MGH1-like glycoside hydrolase domain